MSGLLIASGVISLFIGSAIEAGVLLAFAAGSLSITIAQQHRSERVTDSMRELAARMACVRRDGHIFTVDARGLLVGEIIVVDGGQDTDGRRDSVRRRSGHR